MHKIKLIAFKSLSDLRIKYTEIIIICVYREMRLKSKIDLAKKINKYEIDGILKKIA